MSAEAVERVRMAVAEAGYDPELVTSPGVDGALFSYWPELPDEIAWRAKETVMVAAPECWACSQQRTHVDWRGGPFPPYSCLADRRFMRDCGCERAS